MFRRALDAVGHQKKRSLTRTFSARRLHTPLQFEVAPANRAQFKNAAGHVFQAGGVLYGEIATPISLPYSSLERDFCRRRQTRKKGAGDDISKRRPEIGDHDAREMAAKAPFLLASHQSRVSGDWVVVDAV